MKKIYVIATVLLATALVGCASTEQTAPCPNYGTSCVKKPINSWDNSQY